MSDFPQDPGSERIDIRDLPPLAEGGPVLNPPTPDELLEKMRVRYQEAQKRASWRMVVLPTPRRSTADEEIGAISEAATALEKLDDDAQLRAATWLFDRYAAPRIAEAG